MVLHKFLQGVARLTKSICWHRNARDHFAKSLPHTRTWHETSTIIVKPQWCWIHNDLWCLNPQWSEHWSHMTIISQLSVFTSMDTIHSYVVCSKMYAQNAHDFVWGRCWEILCCDTGNRAGPCQRCGDRNRAEPCHAGPISKPCHVRLCHLQVFRAVSCRIFHHAFISMPNRAVPIFIRKPCRHGSRTPLISV